MTPAPTAASVFDFWFGPAFSRALPALALCCAVVSELRAAAPIALNHTIGVGTTLNVPNNDSLTLTATPGSNALVNNGTLSLSSTGNLTNLILSGAAITFSGSGTLLLSNNANNRIYGAAGTESLTNSSGHTIQGSGQLGLGLLSIVNQGLIVANQSAALTIDPNSDGFTNTGILRATNAATLVLQNGVFANTGGTIEAQADSHVDISGATVSGGTLTSIGTGSFHLTNGSTLSALAISSGSNVELANNDTLHVNGALQNAGTIKLLSIGNLTNLVVDVSGATLSGGGTVSLSNNGNNRIYGATSTTTLVNLDNTIAGAGQIGVNTLQLDNRATIDANQSGGTLTIDPSGSGATNTGTMQASGGGILRLQGATIENTGGLVRAQSGSKVQFDTSTLTHGTVDVAAGGTLELDSSTLTAGSLANANTGVIKTTGGASTLGGTLANAAGGQLQVANNTSLVLQASGTFNNAGTISLNSIGNLTNLIVSGGDVTLAGTGSVTLSNNGNNRIYGAATTDRLINGVGHTIQGSGQLGLGLMGFNNAGMVIANQVAALTIDPSATGVTNTGSFVATNAATLEVTNGNFTNTGGTIEAQAGSTVRFDGAIVVGGTLKSSGTGHLLNAGDTTYTDVALATGAVFDQNNNTISRFGGTLTNQGDVRLNSIGNLTDLIASSSGLTLSGGGTVTLSSNPNNRIYGTTSTTTLVNADNTIRGAGQLGANQLQFDNRGTVDANISGATLTVNPSGSGAVNTGTLQASSGGILTLQDGTFNNTGGFIRAQSGSTVRLDSATVSGGTVEVAAGANVTLSSSTINGGTLTGVATGSIGTVGGANTLGGNVTVNAGTQLNVANNTSLRLLAGGTFVHNGAVSLNSVGNLTDLIVGGGDVALTGNGTVTLGNNANNRIYGANSTTDRLVLGPGIALRGGGQLGVGLMGLNNSGTIEATLPATALTIDPSALGVTNTGVLRATAGATLRVTDGTYANTGGTIEALDGSQVNFEGAVINGGSLRTVNTGQLVNASGSTYQGVTLAAGSLFGVNNNTAATFTGTLVNAGSVTLNSVGNLTDLIAGTGGLTLQGGGTVTLGNNFNNRIYAANGTTTLVNQDNTIRGAGQIGVNQLQLDNRGTVEASVTGGTLQINTSGSGVANTGTLQAVNGATLRLEGSAVNNAGGTIRAVGAGSAVDLSSSSVTGGTLTTSSGGLIRSVAGANTLGGTLTIGSGAQLVVNNATSLTLLAAGIYSNEGSLTLSSVGNFTDLKVSGGDVTLNGGGTIALSNNANNRIYGGGGSDRLVLASGTIRGSGQIGVGLMGLTNQGTIKADQTTSLTIDPSALGVTNTGRLRAEAGATLRLENGTFTNTNGVIEAIGAGAAVEFSGASIINGTLTSDPGATLRHVGGSTFTDVTLSAGSTLEVLNATLAHFSGTLTNHAAVNLTSVGNFTDFVIGGNLLLDGGGTLALSNNGNNRVYGSVATDVLTNQNNAIQGAGQLGVNLLRLDNRGSINANLSGATLVIDPSASGAVNTGLLTATNGGILQLQSGSFDNTGGTLLAGTGSRIELDNASVQGGFVGGSTIRNVAASTLTGVNIGAGAAVEVPNATALTLAGAIVNSGTVAVQSAGNFTDLIIGSAGVTLSGHGVVELSNNGNNRLYGTTGSVVLNNVDNTIRGGGQLGIGQLTLTNTGTIEANQSTALTVNLTNGATFTNQGTLRATNGANLILTDAFTNAALISVQPGSTVTAQAAFTQSGGATSLQGGTLSTASAAFQGGVLQGSGTISGAVTNSAVIAPGANGSGADVGALTFNHALTLTPTSLLHLDLGGAASFDHITAPSIGLNGSLVVTFANSFQAAVQPIDNFTLLSTTNLTGLSGTFAGLPNGARFTTADGYGSFLINYSGNAVTLSQFQALAVPEPSTYALLGTGGMLVFIASRRRRKS